MSHTIFKISYGRIFLLSTMLFSFSFSSESYNPYASQKDIMDSRTNDFTERVKSATENQITQRTKQGKKFNEIKDFAEQKNTTFGRIPADGGQIVKEKKSLRLDAVISENNVETRSAVESDEERKTREEIKQKAEAEIARQNEDAIAKRAIKKTDRPKTKNQSLQSGTIISPF